MEHATTTRKVETLMEMFADATVGESYGENRLITEATDANTVVLTAYGWMALAEYDESENRVTAFFGHKSINSRTVSRWLNRVVDVARRRGRSVVISDESPTLRKPNNGVEFIGNYIGDWDNKSPVEKDAERAVLRSLQYLNKFM